MNVQRILPKFQIPNTRGQKTHCEICNVKFQLIVKQEHQCKRCFRSICQVCGPQRRLVYEADGTAEIHRNCLVCIKEGDWIDIYKNQYKLCFGQDSEFVDEWINKLNKERKSYDDILNEFSDNLTSVTNDNIIRFKRESDAIFKELDQSYNFSLRHFIKVMTDGINSNLFQTKIKNVMISMFGKVKSLPYVPELIYLAAFFLTFASEAHAYFIITRLIQKIYPQYVRVKRMKKDNLLSSSLKTILEMYRVCLDRVDRNQLEIIAQYLQSRFANYIISFTLNLSSITNSFFILDEMLKSGNYLSLYKGIAGMLSHCRQELSAYKTYEEVQIPLLRTVNLEKLKASFVKFQKSDVPFEINNEVFDSAEHRKLFEKFKQIESLYSKSEVTLTEKQTHIKEILTELNKKKVLIDEQKKKISELQEEVVKIAHEIPMLSNYNQMQEIYERSIEANRRLSDECQKNHEIVDRLERQAAFNEKREKAWKEMEEEHTNEIVQLKTKIQILEIEKAAQNIDFNTTYIERKISQKNNQINILHSEIDHLKSDIEFYKLKLMEKNFKMEYDLRKEVEKFQESKKEEKKFQFAKHITISNEVINNLKTELSQNKGQVEELRKESEELKGKIKELEDSLKTSKAISEMVKEIPEEFDYNDCITQIQRLIEKENNFMKKKSLEIVLENFAKCNQELKYRILDSKLKQLKIRNSPLIKILNPDNNSLLLPKEKEEEVKDVMFDEVIKLIEYREEKKEEEEKKDCRIM